MLIAIASSDGCWRPGILVMDTGASHEK